MNIFKKQKKQEAAKKFIDEFRVLATKHGFYWAASLQECPHCKGTGKTVQMQVIELKQAESEQLKKQ